MSLDRGRARRVQQMSLVGGGARGGLCLMSMGGPVQ